MRDTMSGANTSVIGADPSCQAAKARRIVSRLASVSTLVVVMTPPCHV
jgi:hypothetical protein